jgi:micrococcal nuclease
VQTLGVFVLLLCWFSGATAKIECPSAKIHETAAVAHVFDGDTLRLVDGRRVRVLGINTPELARDGQKGEPLGELARDAVRAFLPKHTKVYLAYDQERKDRYGRLLAHVYNHERQSLGAMLLREGLAFQVVVPPNVQGADCLAHAEAWARAKQSGIWREVRWQVRPAAGLALRESGFIRISGVITKVTQTRDVWLELDGPVVVKIAARDRHYFESEKWQEWKGKKVVLRGWLINRASEHQRKKGFKPLQLQLRHPHMLEIAP